MGSKPGYNWTYMRERNQLILTDYQGGVSKAEIGRRYGISRQRVYQIIKQMKEVK